MKVKLFFLRRQRLKNNSKGVCGCANSSMKNCFYFHWLNILQQPTRRLSFLYHLRNFFLSLFRFFWRGTCFRLESATRFRLFFDFTVLDYVVAVFLDVKKFSVGDFTRAYKDINKYSLNFIAAISRWRVSRNFMSRFPRSDKNESRKFRQESELSEVFSREL